MRSVFFALAVSFLACGDNGNNSNPADATKAVDAAGSGQHDAGGSGITTMASIPLPAEANGLYWDATSSTLYLTQKFTGSGNAFEKWTDAGGLATVASLDGITAVNPGGIVKLADGSFLTPNFSSNDTDNGVIQISGSAATLLTEAPGSGAGSAGDYRSIGVALGSDGTTIYQVAFTKVSATDGFVLKTTIGGGSATQAVFAENAAAAPLGKLVGIAVESDGTVFISDQTNNAIWKIMTTGAVSSFATYTHPDLIAKLPNGDLLEGGGTTISRISATTGTVTPLTFGTMTFTYVGGMAFDAVNHRLFIDDQNASTTGGSGDTLDIVPYMPGSGGM